MYSIHIERPATPRAGACSNKEKRQGLYYDASKEKGFFFIRNRGNAAPVSLLVELCSHQPGFLYLFFLKRSTLDFKGLYPHSRSNF